MTLNIDFVRKQFPALSGKWIFFDNAGGTQVLQQVVNRIQDYLLTSNVQLGASYDVSRQSCERVGQGIQAMAEFINARDQCEVILGSSTSMLLKNLSFSLVEVFKPGDEVIVTNCDHEANIGPWRSLEKRGIHIKEWRLNPETLDLHLEDLVSLMTEKTRLVALNHISNILGTINPIKEIASFVHERGAMICVDGVAYAPHRLVDVRELDVDFYAFSFYKVYGPHYSLLYGKKAHLENMPGINHFFLENEIPLKFQPGNVSYELSYSLLGVKDYFTEFARVHARGEAVEGLRNSAALAYECFAQYEETLSARLLDFLDSKPNVRIIGRKEADQKLRVPTISFVIDNVKSSSIPPEVDKHYIGIKYGDFYARRLIEDLGLAPQDGVIRVSMVHYNTVEEVDRLIKIFEKLF
ncbi:MAG: cysteine desulfurase-like protein [Candidatus Aminicenantes bacterium]|nr:MAG: cysteine desulfurase-like protein [Candidatus Aminicenantes bacterium]